MDEMPQFQPEDARALREAHARLEQPSLASQLTRLIGQPVERGLGLLPASWHEGLQRGMHKSLLQALEWVVEPMADAPGRHAREEWHKLMGAASGALGGFFGLPALIAELPLSTAITLRAIADVARDEGEDLGRTDARLACLEVLALGGRTEADTTAETGYYGVRLALAMYLSRLPGGTLGAGILKPGHPVLAGFVAAVARRFGVVVSEKAAVRLVPVLGAVSGAFINVVFIQHFQDVARAHFTVRRLERRYGAEAIRRAYEDTGRSAS